MSAIRKIKRVGKKATKFQYSATYNSVVVECHSEKWCPHMICVAWHRRGRRIVSQILPWLPSPDNTLRGLVVWPEPEVVESTVTLYKGPKDKSYEHKEWDFSVIDVDPDGHRKVLATTSVDMVRYASALPFEHELQLKLKPVSRKIKKILLEVSLSSVFLKEGKATDDDMISLASMMSISNLSMIGNLEDEDDDFTIPGWNTGRSISPEMMNAAVPSTDKLIDWAQEVTNGYSGVKIINMTTSWRNGLAFCAIINYYRPDLLEFGQLSSQSIKENNRLAFDIAQELGIACPLTPNMMLLRDIPDKLAVTAFVYQMYNYFTRAVPSAITKHTTLSSSTKERSGSSPLSSANFDLSQFDQFTFKQLSPVPTEGLRDLSENKYSRHSRKDEEESQKGLEEEPIVEELHTPVKNEDSEKAPVSTSTPVSSDNHHDNQEPHPSPVLTNSNEKSSDHVTVKENKSALICLSNDEKNHNETKDSKSKQDLENAPRHLTPSPPLPSGDKISHEKDEVEVKGERMDYFQTSSHPDQAVLSLNLSQNSVSDIQTTSTNDSSTSTRRTSGIESPKTSQQARRGSEPVISPQSSSPQLDDQKKKEYYRKQFKDMMSNAGINTEVVTFTAISSSTRKRLQRMKQTSNDKLTKPLTTSPTSSSSHSIASSKSDSQLPQSTKETVKSVRSLDEKKHTDHRESDEMNITNNGLSLSHNIESDRLTVRQDWPSDKSGVRSAGNSPLKSLLKDSPNKDSQQHMSSLVISAPCSRPSSAAKKMAKKPPKSETDGDEKNKNIEKVDSNIQQKEIQGVEEVRNEDRQKKSPDRPQDVPGLTCNGSKNSMESPSDFLNHSRDLNENILVSQSDYVKNELMSLHKQLHPLEERAVVVETEIREAMAKGDNEKEELLTIEYFKLLNEKNALIKKQIELNLLEKEEDLEKRQFFINRELRRLQEGPKTEEQKLREQQLIQELLELVNEREWLDQRLTNTTHSSVTDSSLNSHDVSGQDGQQSLSFSASSKVARDRIGSKDCVIS